MKKSQLIKRIGDVDPIEYGGGVVYKDEYGIQLEYTYGSEGIPDLNLPVYRVQVDEYIYDDIGYRLTSLCEMADCKELLSKPTDLDSLVLATLEYGSCYGWENLDSSPYHFTPSELKRRWKL